jgi:hypothetical protein
MADPGAARRQDEDRHDGEAGSIPTAGSMQGERQPPLPMLHGCVLFDPDNGHMARKRPDTRERERNMTDVMPSLRPRWSQRGRRVNPSRLRNEFSLVKGRRRPKSGIENQRRLINSTLTGWNPAISAPSRRTPGELAQRLRRSGDADRFGPLFGPARRRGHLYVVGPISRRIEWRAVGVGP